MALRPETAFRKTTEGETEEVPAAALVVDDVIVLRPGARVPTDGVIAQGRGSLDEANITSESMPGLPALTSRSRLPTWRYCRRI